MRTALAITLIILATSSRASCPTPSIKEAAIFDIASTTLALSQGATELNPFGLVGTSVLKAIMISQEEKLDNEAKSWLSAIWTGAGANNLTAAVGLSFVPAILIGITVGYFVKTQKCEVDKTSKSE